MKKAKSPVKGIKQFHTDSKKTGMGDFYGTGVKNKTGSVRDSSISKPKKSLPPKTLA
jgi:hypothetical protein